MLRQLRRAGSSGLGSPLRHGTATSALGLTPATFAQGLGPPRPHLLLDWAHPSHICAGTGLTPATSALGLQVVMRALLAMHILPSGPEAMVVSDKLRPHMPAGMSSDAARASESVRKRSLFSRPLAALPTSTATTARVDAESLSRFITECSAGSISLFVWLCGVCGARLFEGKGLPPCRRRCFCFVSAFGSVRQL